MVFGHTPVQLLGINSPAKIYRKGSLIDIDCGCVFQDGGGIIADEGLGVDEAGAPFAVSSIPNTD